MTNISNKTYIICKNIVRIYLNNRLQNPARTFYQQYSGKSRDIKFVHTVDQIGSKMGQIRDFFLDQISEHFGQTSQNILKYDMKKSSICHIWGN